MNRNTKFLIIGLGLIGGAYARRLTAMGYHVNALDINPDSIAYAKEEGIIQDGTDFSAEMIAEADFVIFGLYPTALVNWLRENQQHFAPGTLITDVSGVKSGIVDEIQSFLRKDVEFIGSHPMAGRELSGVRNSDERVFHGANFIITPTERNTQAAIDAVHSLAEVLGFGRISQLSIREHDEMIGFLSQLTHVIAISLMNCKDNTHLAAYTGDSFRDLTRIARINENMWSELFLLNKEILTEEIDGFISELENIRDTIKNDDAEALKALMVTSTYRRGFFDKKQR